MQGDVVDVGVYSVPIRGRNVCRVGCVVNPSTTTQTWETPTHSPLTMRSHCPHTHTLQKNQATCVVHTHDATTVEATLLLSLPLV
jgi:hypothetical protein